MTARCTSTRDSSGQALRFAGRMRSPDPVSVVVRTGTGLMARTTLLAARRRRGPPRASGARRTRGPSAASTRLQLLCSGRRGTRRCSGDLSPPRLGRAQRCRRPRGGATRASPSRVAEAVRTSASSGPPPGFDGSLASDREAGSRRGEVRAVRHEGFGGHDRHASLSVNREGWRLDPRSNELR